MGEDERNFELGHIIAGLNRMPPASESEIEEFIALLGFPPPVDYLSLMRIANGLDGFVGVNYCIIWPLHSVIDCGRYEFAPHLVFFGSDGGGEGFAFDTQVDPVHLVTCPFIGGDPTTVRILGKSLMELFAHLQRGPLLQS